MAKRLAVLIVVIAGGTFLLRHAASFLVVSHPEHSDAIVVLAGDDVERRYRYAVKLLQQGYANHILVDVDTQYLRWGVSDLELATRVIDQTSPGVAQVCASLADSTAGEAQDTARCLAPLNPRSVLLVTSDYHTRRAFSIYRKCLPQYQWSVAAMGNSYFFGTAWWTRRRWAKTTLEEWEKLLWWELVERFHTKPYSS